MINKSVETMRDNKRQRKREREGGGEREKIIITKP